MGRMRAIAAAIVVLGCGCHFELKGLPLDPGVDAAAAGGVDADGASPDLSCPILHIHDDFATLDGATWINVGAATAAGGRAIIVPQYASYAKGGLWLRTPHSFEQLHVTFNLRIDHDTSVCGGAPPSDGFAIFWLHDANGGSAPPPVGTNAQALAVPSGYVGLGVEVDTYRSPGPPHTAYVAPDPQKGTPNGNYDWHVGNSARQLPFTYNAWHTVDVSFKLGHVDVTIDSFTFSADAPAYSPFAGYLGFTAANGCASDGFYVSSFDATFSWPQSCTP